MTPYLSRFSFLVRQKNPHNLPTSPSNESGDHPSPLGLHAKLSLSLDLRFAVDSVTAHYI
jgi:hypothetical protein